MRCPDSRYDDVEQSGDHRDRIESREMLLDDSLGEPVQRHQDRGDEKREQPATHLLDRVAAGRAQCWKLRVASDIQRIFPATLAFCADGALN